ncbi:DNA repair and recombination protein Rhp26p [Spironucleus salmonicida]|uniref:DNA repair and recombination protein Rhp26p n=1 Tax=Spironucleus salmonicida TaxID=348837 RepID=V6M1V3_9EUKA|nr:DNA repair and recombination protein Rhp26p [Spironucleus salmonicida]|eukprot:EST47164.1 DNA repair and recombination protein Rhp26p [Spironucleus salmonicida]
MSQEKIKYLQQQLVTTTSLKDRLLIQDTIDEIIQLQKHKITSTYDIADCNLYDQRLKQFQKQGITWLLNKFQYKQNCLLADEPGLGKTVQVINFLNNVSIKSVLILAPPTLCYQWIQMSGFWNLKYNISHIKKYSDLASFKEGIMIISYDLAVINIKILSNFSFDILISDEVHYLRNVQTQRYAALQLLKAKFRIGLSGTPIQNTYEELYAIFNFLNIPGLPSQEIFYERYVDPIKLQIGSKKIQAIKSGAAAAKQLQGIVNPAILRRLKRQVGLELPPKDDQTILFKLSVQQEQCYKQLLQSKIIAKKTAFYVIQQLSQVCDYPYIDNNQLIFDCAHSNKIVWIVQKICDIFKIKNGGQVLNHLIDIRQRIQVFDCEISEEEFNELEQTEFDISIDKLIIFAPSIKFLLILEEIIYKLGLTYHLMTGTTSQQDRKYIVESFNQQQIQILLSTPRVGGIGLNLTSANHVIITQPSWNPAIDSQASQRVWRIGQQRKTNIYRFAAAGTVEEVIIDRQQLKQIMADRILENAFEQIKTKMGSVFAYYCPMRDIQIRKFEEKSTIKTEQVSLLANKQIQNTFAFDFDKLASDLLDRQPFITDSFFPPPIDMILGRILKFGKQKRDANTPFTNNELMEVLMDYHQYAEEIQHCIRISLENYEGENQYRLKNNIYL